MQIWKDIEGYKNVFVSIQEAARKGNFSATAICKVCKGKGNLHKGYKWRYKK